MSSKIFVSQQRFDCFSDQPTTLVPRLISTTATMASPLLLVEKLAWKAV